MRIKIMNMNAKNWFLLSKAKVAIGLFIVGLGMIFNMGVAHAELSIIEKDPESSIVYQYNQYKASDLDGPSFINFVDQLNNRIDQNPQDSLAWEVLAKVYYEHGDIEYAVYAANEAVDLGANDNELYSILLTGSTILAVDQIEAGYDEQINDKKFLEQYQASLSRAYGTMHGFNYNEALPKPTIRSTPSKATKKYKSNKSVSKNKRVKVKSKPKRSTKIKKTKKPVSKPKRSTTPKKATKPVSKPKRQTPPKKSSSDDPFKILR